MRPLDGYPASTGYQMQSVAGIQGPASYTQITPGTAPAVATGGQTIYPNEFGLKYFDYVSAGLSDTGINRVECIPGAPSNAGPSGACASYTLRWVVVATGAQVAGAVDLSSEYVRVRALGPK
jgi:hypothetical protein